MKKTIALTCILKNERHNLERFCKSFGGLFDEYHFTDTGSTDGSVEWLRSEAIQYLGVDATHIYIHHYVWNRNFAAARNHALSSITTDYWLWADLDDCMRQRDNFLAWKNEAMSLCDAWYFPYNYSLKPDGEPLVSFIRERVFKTKLGFKFDDIIHEGVDIRKVSVKLGREIVANMVKSFAIDHHRTAEEAKGDKGRNLSILEDNVDILSDRLKYYYGKELFDIGRYEDSCRVLKEIVRSAKLEPGDRTLALQYCAMAHNNCGKFVDSIEYSLIGINLDPNRAENYCLAGESYIKLNMADKAVPFYAAAKACYNSAAAGLSHEFAFSDCYTTIPCMHLAKIYFFRGEYERALKELNEITNSNSEAEMMKTECLKAIEATTMTDSAMDCDDIVISCPFPNAYPWDEELYKTKGLGGSETAAVEMAKYLHELTGRQVKIFQHRDLTFVAPSGVEYIPAHHIHDYFKKWKPSLHVAWRHSARLTNALSVVWSHDLSTPGIENFENYDKIFALSEFHKQFMMGTQGVPEDKILVTRNGINPDRFTKIVDKVASKVIWPNSPDRGLEYAIQVIDLVRKEIPDVSLHVFYGFDNMKKWGLADKAALLEDMISKRPWIKNHGNVDQTILAKEFSESSVWLYTASFVESFCITALESLVSKAWPVVREFGALKSTLKEAKAKGWGDIIDCDMDQDAIPIFAEKVIEAIRQEKWKTIEADSSKYSWKNVAEDWVKVFEL